MKFRVVSYSSSDFAAYSQVFFNYDLHAFLLPMSALAGSCSLQESSSVSIESNLFVHLGELFELSLQNLTRKPAVVAAIKKITTF